MNKPLLPSGRIFVDEVRKLYSQNLDKKFMWTKIKENMIPLLEDPELKESSQNWPLTVEDVPKVKNLFVRAGRSLIFSSLSFECAFQIFGIFKIFSL